VFEPVASSTKSCAHFSSLSLVRWAVANEVVNCLRRCAACLAGCCFATPYPVKVLIEGGVACAKLDDETHVIAAGGGSESRRYVCTYQYPLTRSTTATLASLQ